jgi:glycosyltransferase involved in cell wall biosynthesis
MSASTPPVSIIVPMFNEEAHIEACVSGLLAQRYDGEMEVLVVDGGSSDGSPDIVRDLARRDARVRLVANPRRCPAAAANIGVAEARGEVLCFMSAHGEPADGYVARSVDLLLASGAAGVGGAYEHVGSDRSSRAIGLAMSSRFGMASTHRMAGTVKEVDTISHPTFWRAAVIAAGGYDESLTSNEDYELNHRVRTTVGPLLFSPEIRSVYRPRASVPALARQFSAYGVGKAEVARRHPDSVRWRHVVPPALVVGTAVAPLLVWWKPGRIVVGSAAVGYVGLLGAALALERPWAHDASPATFLLALPTMHVSWGSGVLRGLARRRRG